MILPFPFQNWFFSGHKLFRHLQSGLHQKSKHKSALCFSYLKRIVDYYSLVLKGNMDSPQICIKWIKSYSRIDSHIEKMHQLKWNSNDTNQTILKSRRYTHQFTVNYLEEIWKIQLVENEPVLSQQLENINLKKKRKEKEN